MAEGITIKLKVPGPLLRALRDPKSAAAKRFQPAIKKSLTIAYGEVAKNIVPGWGGGFKRGIFTGSAGLLGTLNYQITGPLKGILGVNKVYAAIQEFGGVIKPRHKKMLAWYDKIQKTWIFAKKVTLKPKRYFSRGVKKARKPIERTLRKAVKDIARDLRLK